MQSDTVKSDVMNKVYQRNDSSYLPDSQQPKPLNTTIYNPHESTRYLNVTTGQNNLPMIKSKNGEWKECNLPLPELYGERQNCCGCTACYSVCPINAISMLADEKGFDYPVIDASKCIRCYNCKDVCPIEGVS